MRLLGRILVTAVETLLSTAGVLVFLGGLLGRSPLAAITGALATVGGVLAFSTGWRKTPPERRLSLWLHGAVALLTAFLSLILVAEMSSSRVSPLRNASASLKTLASAEADFRANDRDHNQINDYWVGDVAALYLLVPEGGGEPIKLIEISVAAADPAPSPSSLRDREKYMSAGPKAGYLFRALTYYEDDAGKLVPYDEGNGRNTSRFGFVASPKTYGKETRKAFIVNEDNTIWMKDTGGKPVVAWPKDPKADGWAKLD